MSDARIGNWYFGWNIVAAATVLTLLTVGMRLGVGPFFLPMVHDLGFSRSLLAAIVAVGMLCYGLAMPLAGYLVGKYSTRVVLLLGTAIVGISVAWAVNTRDPLGFGFSFGVLMSIGLAFVSPVSLAPVISRWFTRQRGMALFFLSTGSMAGIAIMTPVMTHVIEASGWKVALMGFAVIFAAMTIPTALFFSSDKAPAHTDLLPEQISLQQAATGPAAQSPPLRDAVRTTPFWKLIVGLFACGYSMNLLGTHGLPMLMDHGFSATSGSLGLGLIGVIAILGTLILGRMSDLLPRRKILAAIYGIRGLGFFALVMVGAQWELYTTAAIGGLVWAGSMAVSSAIMADVYGVRILGVLYGFAYIAHQVGATISSWLGGWAYEAFGTHWISFGSAAVILLIASAVSLMLPDRGFSLMIPGSPPEPHPQAA